MSVINALTVTEALKTILTRYPDLEEARIERGEPVNQDASRTPWVGVYKVAQRHEVAWVGSGRAARRTLVDVLVVCQESDARGGEDTENRLDVLVAAVVDAILADETLGTGLATTELRVQYADARQEESGLFQEAGLFLTFVTQ